MIRVSCNDEGALQAVGSCCFVHQMNEGSMKLMKESTVDGRDVRMKTRSQNNAGRCK
jgi:hypothetical protein